MWELSILVSAVQSQDLFTSLSLTLLCCALQSATAVRVEDLPRTAHTEHAQPVSDWDGFQAM